MAPKFVQGQDGWHHAVSQVQATLVLRPSDHLNLTKHDPCQIHTALRTQAALAPADASKFMVRVDKSKNLAFLLCLDSHVTQPLQEITSVDLEDRRCGVTIYPATPSNTCKGVIHNIPAGTSPEYLMRHMSTLRPEFKILAARMMGRTTTALITFHGTHIPHEICYAGGIFRCRPHRPKAQYCHRCQQIGHRIDVCTYNARCPTCGQLKPDDDSHTCSADPVCLRCGGPHRADDAACKDKQAADAAVRQLAYNKRIAQRKAALKAEGVAAAASATAPPKAPSGARSRSRSRTRFTTPSRRSRSRTRFTTPSRRRTSSSPRRTHTSSGRSPAGTRGHSPTAHQTPSRLPSHQWEHTQEYMGSDHAILHLTVSETPRRIRWKPIRIIDWHNYRQDRSDPPFTDIPTWTQQLTHALDQRTKILATNEIKPHIDTHLAHSWEARASLLKRWKRCKTNRKLRARIDRLNEHIQQYSDQLSSEHWNASCDELQNTLNTAKTWSILKALINPDSTKTMTTHKINRLTNQHTDPDTLLAAIKGLYVAPACQPRYPNYEGSPHTGLDEEFTYAELRAALRQCKGSKATGPDLVTTALLRNLSDADQDHLLHSINLVWTGKLPLCDLWKKGHMIFIPKPGRLILHELGYTPHPTGPQPTPLDNTILQHITVAPIPRHMDKDRNPTRRLLRAAYYTRKISRDPESHHVFTDAALKDTLGAFAYFTSRGTEHSETQRCASPVEAELLAIALAAANNSSPGRTTHIYTDSKSACSHLAQGLAFPSALPLLNNVRGPLHIHWIPGHAGVAGNERAHQLARETLLRAPADACDTAPVPPPPLPTLADLLASRCTFPPPHTQLTRREQTLIRQAQTYTLLTPARLHLFRRSLGDPLPLCSRCLTPSDQDHLLWDCPHNPAQPHTYTREWLALAVSLEQQRELAAHINRALSGCLD
ncbi:hypothetical protein ISCGN_016192 [Ixodes scapularis]